MTSRKGAGAKSARARLVYFVQELERLEAEKIAATEAFNEEMSRAAAEGFDRATLRVVLKLRKLTPAQRKERRALEAIYLASLGMLDGDPLPDEARKRFDPPDPPPASGDGGSPPAPPLGGADPSTTSAAPIAGQIPMPFKDPAEARAEGSAAAAAGKRVYDNPYPAGDPCRAAWDEGWCESSGSHGMDTPAAYQRRKDPPEEAAAPPGRRPGEAAA
jgi:uncharacterized protein (UPF0335 family)